MDDPGFLEEFYSDDEQPGRGEARGARTRRGHLPEALAAAVLALALALVPLAAHAAGSEGSSKGSEASAAAHDAGLSVAKKKTALARGKDVKTTASGDCGIAASNGGTYLAGELTLKTVGDESPAVSVGAASKISLVSSKLSTAHEQSPLVHAAGTAELEDVSGNAKASPLAQLADGGSLFVSNSTLSSAFAGEAALGSLVESITGNAASGSLPATGAVMVYGTDEAASLEVRTASDAGASSALLQVSGSTLSSDIQAGALFYFTNAQAKVVLSNTELDFDSSAANLIAATGNDVGGWGSAGKNGAAVTFTCYGEQPAGNIVADSISSLDFYLLEGTSWKGAASIAASGASSSGEAASANISVNIDATSGWVLTEDSTVTNLNLAPGGKLVDEDGDAVKIVDADGNKLVDGASDIEVKVQGSFSTAVTTTSANELEPSVVDRAKYDDKYGTSTAFGSNGEATSPSVEDRIRELAEYIANWFKGL